MGVSEALRPRGVFIQAHEPASSAAIGGGEPGPFLIQGWTGIVMPHWDPFKVDHLEPIEDDAAVAMTLRLAREEGIFAGISTGANVVGAHRLAERLGPGRGDRDARGRHGLQVPQRQPLRRRVTPPYGRRSSITSSSSPPSTSCPAWAAS